MYYVTNEPAWSKFQQIKQAGIPCHVAVIKTRGSEYKRKMRSHRASR